MGALRDLGFLFVRFVDDLGKLALFTVEIVIALLTPPVRARAFVTEVFKLGVLSLIIICVSGLAVGMVLGLQGYNTLVRFGAEQSLGAVVGLSLIRELGPVLTALLATGRAGSATAAEIGTMVATEQLDGLRMMSINPIHLVVTPKATAMIAVMPLLSGLFIVCGLFGGYAVGVGLMGLDGGIYMSSLRSAVDFHDDVLGSLLKALIFGVLIGLIATYRGYTSAPTSEGVSAATTSTVVISGVKVGQVKDISLDPSYRARIEMDLDNRLKLPTDTSASIVTAGILGDRYVSLQVGGEEQILKSGDTMTFTESALILESLIGKFIYGRTGGGAAGNGAGAGSGSGGEDKSGAEQKKGS